MPFVYIHIAWFACWIGFGLEKYPYGLLTMIVSLEAIFLSTFVMISQNRADAKRQAIADEQWQTVKEEDSRAAHDAKHPRCLRRRRYSRMTVAQNNAGCRCSSPGRPPGRTWYRIWY